MSFKIAGQFRYDRTRNVLCYLEPQWVEEGRIPTPSREFKMSVGFLDNLTREHEDDALKSAVGEMFRCNRESEAAWDAFAKVLTEHYEQGGGSAIFRDDGDIIACDKDGA